MNRYLTFKSAATLALSITMLGALQAQPITTPRPSPGASVSQTIGISEVTINYSRPFVKDRQIWGALVPYGWNKQGFGYQNPAPWRAGANENSTITLSHDAIIEGKSVPAGTYSLFYVINEDNTGEVVINTDNQAWGSFFYQPENDVMRAPIKVQDIDHSEMLTFQFINVDGNSATLVLDWEKKRFPVKISFDVNQIVYENAVAELTGTVGFTWQGFNSAANYLAQNNFELEQALKWADAAVARNNSFTTLNTKAAVLEAMGKTAEAEGIRQEALAIATEAEVNLRGYQLLNQGKNDEAIALFIMNTKKYPKSANAWDSLGEAYALSDQKDMAIKHFKKALSLNPPANVKANSEKYMKQLQASN